ncbi:MAG: cytochrome C biogenesis protein CcdA [Candidatus Parcubacteria bacterium]|nr:MAG: cytochrome C biogenesis protein CcdA [Candidatus Parcubacteria bacterium]
MELSLIIPSFIAGILMFFAPCTFPLVPGYLAFISNISFDELNDQSKIKILRKRIFKNGLLFVIGFTLIFMILGTIAGFIGQSLGQYRFFLNKLGGVFVIFFGLFMLDIVKIPILFKELKLKPPKFFNKNNPLNSFIFGVTFALGWTPCIGPILGTILTLAANSATVIQGAFLLFIFSLGLAIPFLTMALLIGSAFNFINKFSRYLKVISIIGGLFLIFLGILIFTNKLGIWVSFVYDLFKFINYDKLLEKL